MQEDLGLVRQAAPVITTADIKAIARAEIESDLMFARKISQGGRAFWGWLVAAVCALFAALFAALYLHQGGILDLGVVAGEAGGPIVRRPIDAQNLLSVLLPVFAVVGAFIVGITGLQRLQAYDEEFRENRTERRDDMRELRDQNDRTITAGLTNAEKAAERAASQEARRIAEDVFDDRAGALVETLQRAEARAEDVDRQIKERVERIEWVFRDQRTEQDLEEGSIQSMGQLYGRVKDLFGRGEGRAAQMLVGRALERPMRGAPSDFLNTAMELAQRDLEPMAYEVAEMGRQAFPKNADLLASALRFASEAGKEATDLLAQPRRSPRPSGTGACGCARATTSATRWA